MELKMGKHKNLLKKNHKIIIILFSSLQVRMVSMRWEKPMLHPTPSLRRFPNVAFETVSTFV